MAGIEPAPGRLTAAYPYQHGSHRNLSQDGRIRTGDLVRPKHAEYQAFLRPVLRERPAGVEPALPPWQGGRLPLHHGRCRCAGLPKIVRAPGWDSNPRLRAPKARGFAATLHPARQSERPELNRRSLGPRPGAIPGFATFPCQRLVRESNPPRGLERAASFPIDERAVSARGRCAVGREVLEPSSAAFQAAAIPSQLPAQQKNPVSRARVTPGSPKPIVT